MGKKIIHKEPARNFFKNQGTIPAIIFAIIWWLFPVTLGFYNLFASQEEKDSGTYSDDTKLYHAILGIFVVLAVLKLGNDFYSKKKPKVKK